MKRHALWVLLLTLPLGLHGELSPPSDAVLKPTFMTGYDSFSGGTAFVCRVPTLRKTVILTAHHLFGPACGWKTEFKWNELRATFEAMTGLSMAHPKLFVTATEVIELPGARGWDDNGYDKDIAAWVFPEECMLPQFELAERMPTKGETVVMLGRERGKERLEQFEAVVETSTPTTFTYRYTRKGRVNFAGTSGAPVLDSAGRVVAINLGGSTEGETTTGVGNPLPSILQMLKAGLGAPAPTGTR